jgi:hypothetical protein
MAAAKWSVLTYIAAHNDLERLGTVSRQQILGVGSSVDVVHGMLYDGSIGGARYVVGTPGNVRIQEVLGAFDSGDPDALIETAKWFFGHHPAERYALILWSHGTGWVPSEIADVAEEVRPDAARDDSEAAERGGTSGSLALFRSTLREMLTPDRPTERAILFDDGSGQSIDTVELERVGKEIMAAIGKPLELLGMDACLMGNVEVAYQLRNTVRHFVASPELVPGHSWPYATIYGQLKENANQDGAALARTVVGSYVASYRAKPPLAGDVTKVALDLGRIDGLKNAANGLAKALLEDIGRSSTALWTAQAATQKVETRDAKRSPSKFDFHLWDLGAIATALEQSSDVSASVKSAARETVEALRPGAGAVLAEGHYGQWFDGTFGVSVYLPVVERISPWYQKVAFAADAQWHDMLVAYRKRV